MAKKIDIGGELHSVATGNIVADAKEIKYRPTGKEEKTQAQVNDELIEAVGSGGGVDARIASAVNAAKAEIKGNASSDCDTLGEAEALIASEASRAGNAETALSNRITPLEAAVGQGGSIDNRISGAIDELDATASQTAANANGHLNLSVTEENGKITGITGSIDNAAYLEENDSSAVIADFDPQTDTVWKKAQTLSAADKAQVKTNLGLPQEIYSKTEVNDLVDTPHQNYVTVAAYASLPASGLADTIYRVSNYNGSTSQVDATKYSEYAWDGSDYVFLSVKSQVDEVFDISEYNASAKYADLAAALGTNGANVPEGVRKGGMSVKYVNTDNKYVQYFLTKDEWSLSEADWQKMNLEEEVSQLGQKVGKSYFGSDLNISGFYNLNDLSIGDEMRSDYIESEVRRCGVFEVKKGQFITVCSYLNSGTVGANRTLILTDTNRIIKYWSPAGNTMDYTEEYLQVFVENDGYAYINSNTDKLNIFEATITHANLETEQIDKKVLALSNMVGQNQEKASKYILSSQISIEGFYNTNELSIGDTMPSEYYDSELRRAGVFKVFKGQYIYIHSYLNSNVAGACLSLILTDTDKVIKYLSPARNTMDYTSELLYHKIEYDGYAYIHSNTDKLNVFECCISDDALSFPYLISKIFNNSNRIEIIEQNCIRIKATNIGGFVCPNKKILLSGASISEPRNGYFEYAMQELGITGTNISNPGTNIMYLANILRWHGAESGAQGESYDFVHQDILLISHIHNHNVNNLPNNLESYTPTDYENDAELGDYMFNGQHLGGELPPSASYSTDELYSIGFDYVIKKWAALCYSLRTETGYNSVFGKPCQIILYTYWHDARVNINNSIRELAMKWGIPLIKDDENIGFSKNQVHPITRQQWSVLYADTTGYQPTEVIDGVTYGVHPDRMTETDYNAWQNSGVLQLSYLPYIQKRRSAILRNFLKDAILDL